MTKISLLFFGLLIIALKNCEGKNNEKHNKKTANIEKKIVKMDKRLENIEAMMHQLLEENHIPENTTNEIPPGPREVKHSPESCQTQCETNKCAMKEKPEFSVC